jgi:hypothetical protein
MTDRPILFSAPMIKALLAGHKTQTRRLIKNPQFRQWTDDGKKCDVTAFQVSGERNMRVATGRVITAHELHYRIGDHLWTRETLRYDWESNLWRYDADRWPVVADMATPTSDRWPLGVCVSIHQPRAASRLTLTATDVRVQRLQDISEADARAEGAPWYVGGHGRISDDEYAADPGYQPSKRAGFEDIWREIHGETSWFENPWVVALTFTVERRNIDALAATEAA